MVKKAITSEIPRQRNHETRDVRKAQRAEHADRMNELKREQKDLSRNIKKLDKELGIAIRKWKNIPSSVRENIHERLKSERSKSTNNAVEQDFLRDLLHYEHIGAELKEFLSKPESLFLIAMLIAITPGTGFTLDLIRRNQQTPEIITMLTGITSAAFVGIGSSLYRLVALFGESQKVVQQEIDSLREMLQTWQSRSILKNH